MSDAPIFGNRLPNVHHVRRAGVYALITNPDAELALVENRGIFFLPGGGSWSGESLEETLAREVREELAWEVSVDSRLGAAIQYLVADGGIQYELRPTYLLGTRIGRFNITPEHSPSWRPLNQAVRLLHRPCDAWAVSEFNILSA
ncbi:MAG: NUDIX domain-containing protein [SAR202 cluster bacterium]|jgi:8-oxo-dGTP pyrophosphatase MutT (NUDIX family)|nr:NUDIX domain-containing protein [SAR202 cluster bacterium]MDP6713210.1 NUDIX domain-containing protein [SAR202 cluster bacterium]